MFQVNNPWVKVTLGMISKFKSLSFWSPNQFSYCLKYNCSQAIKDPPTKDGSSWWKDGWCYYLEVFYCCDTVRKNKRGKSWKHLFFSSIQQFLQQNNLEALLFLERFSRTVSNYKYARKMTTEAPVNKT